MKKLIYGSLFLALVGIVIIGCNKEGINQNEIQTSEVSNSNTSKNRQSESTSFAWIKNVSKQDFLLALKDQVSPSDYESFKSNALETIPYLIVNNNGMFEEYIKFDNSGIYLRLSSYEISDKGSSTIQIKYVSNKLYLNKKELKGFSEFNDFDDITSVDTIPLAIGISCCSACYIVHDILDIHELDCICCLASCGFSCGPFFSIEFSMN